MHLASIPRPPHCSLCCREDCHLSPPTSIALFPLPLILSRLTRYLTDTLDWTLPLPIDSRIQYTRTAHA
ncbi:hypothetical protein CH063_01451 [Colletotrichum higginsianum]|uniref:Uncharacterized protein n=1 Tax=Colletotrichum higginsianum (strain IMI 349063) TaxID=759273 RepID=H1V7J8_COLHI|nr:hypothetical protein CH063_01451 [Colletotrichum higginsianum]